ncbi:hypothetical protein HN789_05140 [archaeon]|mgnify:CR=1 FL=1|jgi:hypothetical protein|nr:hypothetical protein [archaeon]MBT4022896.1 hypothetical protein [archaeon]MBT4272543.1 hypothetical protein [archaeon]MBT4460389.1 hypothetical protein [archaeon]MBT4859020.1 hypothetical protein [archaeon]
MTSLIVLLSTGKGTWAKTIKIINSHTWDKIIIVTNEFGKSTFQKKDNMELIVINPDDPIKKIISKIKDSLNIIDTEVALNLSSGSGKEHMALLSAILKSGLGIRLITYETELTEL